MPKGKKENDRTPSETRFDTPDLDLEDEPSTSRNVDSSTTREKEISPSRGNDTSKSRQVDKSKNTRSANPDTEEAPASRLKQQLEVLMEAVDLPPSPGRLSEKTNAHISSDTDQRLRQAASVLEQRYGKGFSKSLLVDYALRIILRDLRERADDSQIAQVLDQLFDDGA